MMNLTRNRFLIGASEAFNSSGDRECINNTLKATSLFQHLGAVQNGQLCAVPYGRYNQGALIAVNLMPDDIERCLLQHEGER